MRTPWLADIQVAPALQGAAHKVGGSGTGFLCSIKQHRLNHRGCCREKRIRMTGRARLGNGERRPVGIIRLGWLCRINRRFGVWGRIDRKRFRSLRLRFTGLVIVHVWRLFSVAAVRGETGCPDASAALVATSANVISCYRRCRGPSTSSRAAMAPSTSCGPAGNSAGSGKSKKTSPFAATLW